MDTCQMNGASSQTHTVGLLSPGLTCRLGMSRGGGSESVIIGICPGGLGEWQAREHPMPGSMAIL